MTERVLRVISVAMVAALVISAGPAPRRAADDVFDAMRANRLATPMPAPGVTLPALDGGSMRLEDLRGRVVILGFFVSG
jgi:cytochrome oxidase Cu insertion factor (SCO1/SenC/PrrC family)